MLSRLKPILALLIAMVVCGASSQAAVCELSCGLDAKGMACHMAAPSQKTAMQPMPHEHCASKAAMQAASAAVGGVQVGSLHSAACGHTFSLAIENPFAAKARLGVAAISFRSNPPIGNTIPRFAVLIERPPPRIAAATSLLTTLRV